VLAPAFHGRGYGIQAARAILAWGDAHLPTDRTVCLIASDNVRSVRLAERVGYTVTVTTTLNGEPTLLLQRPRAMRP